MDEGLRTGLKWSLVCPAPPFLKQVNEHSKVTRFGRFWELFATVAIFYLLPSNPKLIISLYQLAVTRVAAAAGLIVASCKPTLELNAQHVH